MKIFITLLFLLMTPALQAEQLMSEGILQAYWKAEWNDDATMNTPKLALRFFPATDSSLRDKVFDIRFKDQKTALTFVIKNFKTLPDNFLRYKEWFTNQKGTLYLKNPEPYIECRSENYMAEIINFIPDFSVSFSDTTSYEDMAHCGYNGDRPFLTSYYLNPEYKIGYFNSEPGDNVAYVKTFNIRDRIVKISTVNKQWIYAAVYDDTKPDRLGDRKGYVNTKYLIPFN